MKTAEEVRKITLELTEEELRVLRISVFHKKEKAKENLEFWAEMARKSEAEGGLTHEDDVKHVEYWKKEITALEAVYKKVWETH